MVCLPVSEGLFDPQGLFLREETEQASSGPFLEVAGMTDCWPPLEESRNPVQDLALEIASSRNCFKRKAFYLNSSIR